MTNLGIPWGRIWLTVAVLAAVTLAVGFTLEFVGIDLFGNRFL